MCMSLLSAYSLCNVCLPGVQRPEKGIKSLGTRVADGCKLSCGCWEIDPSPLEEQEVLLTTETPL